MIAYTLKNVLSLVPEAAGLVKQASLDKEYPLDNKDACLASALCIAYHANIDHDTVNPYLIEKIASAVKLHDLTNTVASLSTMMVNRSRLTKQAEAKDEKAEYMTKEASFEGERCGLVDFDRLTKLAEDLYEEALSLNLTLSDAISLYSGNAYLSKEAAVGALRARFQLTQDPVFVKLAVAIDSNDRFNPSRQTIQDLCKTVARLDKQASLSTKGFDFYKEALIVKKAGYSATMRVRLGNQEFPLEKILRIPPTHLEHYMGKDFADELKGDPANAEALVEALPDDLKQVLLTLLKNC